MKSLKDFYYLLSLDRRYTKTESEIFRLVRGDTGYNNAELIEIIEEEGVSYVFGYNVQGKKMKKGLFAHIAEMYAAAPGSSISMSQEILAKLPATGLFAEVKPPKRRRKVTSTTAGGKARCCGFYHNYQGKKWKKPRTVAVKAKASVELYEEIFCSRGEDERLNCEWKAACCAARCSLNGFFANSLRMTISLVVMQILEEFRQDLLRSERPHKALKKRHGRKRNTTRAHCAEKRRYGPTIRLIRKFLICVPAMLRELKTRLVLSLPPMPAIWHHRFGILME